MDLPRDDASALHLLLANLFLREADADLLAQLAKPDIADVLELLEPGSRAWLQDTTWDEPALDELASEYARLFLLPGGVSPYAVAWMDGEEGNIRARLGDEIGSVMEALRVRPAEMGLGNVPSDHIGMLLALTAVALQTEEAPAGGGLVGRIHDLMRAWAPAFADGLHEKADTPLYRAAARLLQQLFAD